MTDAFRLEARGISKSFPGVRALAGVDLCVRPGEVVSVVGENGAGKSTLMKVLAGIHAPDEGAVLVDGERVPQGSIPAALGAGIVLVHQELVLCDNLDVAGNVFLGREPRRGPWLDDGRAHAETERLLARLNAEFSADDPVSELSLGEQQLVEIAKALSLSAKVVILDEPTSSLTTRETERLFAVIRDLSAQGVAVLYISHRLAEVQELSDAVLVLRDGVATGTLVGDAIEPQEMVRRMVGRDVVVATRAPVAEDARTVLEVRGLRTAAHPEHEVSFTVKAGEKLGLAGLVGAGRTEVLRAIFGVERPRAGVIRVEGEVLDAGHPREAVQSGMALVPEDRKGLALFLEDELRTNLSIAALFRHQALGWIVPGWERAMAERAVRDLGIKARDVDVGAGTLSGGNQQKVVLARWLELAPRVLLLDEPTRGVDVGARHEIYAVLDELSARGVAILFASSEMEELLHLADRVLVLREGRVTGELGRSALGEEAVLSLATRSDAPNQRSSVHA